MNVRGNKIRLNIRNVQSSLMKHKAELDLLNGRIAEHVDEGQQHRKAYVSAYAAIDAVSDLLSKTVKVLSDAQVSNRNPNRGNDRSDERKNSRRRD